MHDVIWEALSLAARASVCVRASARAGASVRAHRHQPARQLYCFLGCDWAQGGDSFCHD